MLLVLGGLLQDKLLGCTSSCCLVLLGVDALIHLDHVVDIDVTLLNGRIELGGGLVAHLLDHARQSGVVGFYLAVLEPALQGFSRQLSLPRLPLVDGVLDLVARPAGDSDVEPVEAWRLGSGCDDFHSVAAAQAVVDLLVLAVNLAAHAGAAHAAVDVVGKVQDCRPLWQADDVALGCEDKHLVVVQVGVHIAHQAHLAFLSAGFKHLAHLVHPLVHVALALDALVPPVCRHAPLGGLVHATGAYLDFDPFVVRTIHGDVQRLVAVALGNGDPVLEARGISLVDVGHNRVGKPAGAFLVLPGCVEDDADGEQVVDAAQIHALLLHLLPDAVDGLGAPFELKFQAFFFQPFVDGLDKLLDISITLQFGLVKAGGNLSVNLAVEVFQGQVLELGLDGV